MVHKNVRIALKVSRFFAETGEFSTVYFERPIGFEFEAGDWINIDFADTSLKGGKVYSLSSSPTEDELAISFRNGISDLKRKAREQQLNSLLANGANRYYIAGLETMVEATENLLLDSGVAVRDIRIDSFGNY